MSDRDPRARGAPDSDMWPVLTRLVDALPGEGMLCSAHGRVLHANAPARRRLADPRVAGPLQHATMLACTALPGVPGGASAPRDPSLPAPGTVRRAVTLGGMHLELRAVALGCAAEGATSAVLVLLHDETLARTPAADPDPVSPRVLERLHLTPAERVIARMLQARRTDAEIACALAVSVRTVQSHVQHIFAKLGVHSRRAVGPALAAVPDVGGDAGGTAGDVNEPTPPRAARRSSRELEPA